MKIINSHYIPLPEPRWLIADPSGRIYEHLGTLAVIEEDSNAKKGQYSIVTHQHPVVAFADTGFVEDAGDRVNIMSTLTIPNGVVLNNVLLEECTQICLAKHRKLSYHQFNILAMKFMTGEFFEDFSLDEFIEELKTCGIKLSFPKDELQEIDLTLFDGKSIGMIISDPSQMFFAVPFWASLYKEGKQLVYETEDEKILMEFVNQARAYLKLNPQYRFHFNSSLDVLSEMVDKLNNELNDYLERKEA